MTKISNQVVYIPDTEISGLDYFIGTDIDQGKRTVNFRMEDLGSHFNMVNGVRNFDFNFYEHQGVNPKPSDGYFYSNDNNQDPNNITHFIFSKKTARNKDSSTFFESIATDNPFDLIISQKIDDNTVFFFRINSIETFSNYYKLNVSEVFFPNGKEISYTLSYAIFNLKSEGEKIHNNLQGLNDGDYKHLTAAEKVYFDELPTKLQLKQNLPTGFVIGLTLSIHPTDNTKAIIAPGGYIVTDFSDVLNIVPKIIEVTEPIVFTPEYLETSPSTYVALDIDKNIISSASPFDNDDRRTLCLIGNVVHSNLTNINAVNEIKAPIIAPTNQLHDVIKAIGFLNLEGNQFSANGANLSLNKTAGKIFGLGINGNDYLDPHRLPLPQQIALTFRYRLSVSPIVEFPNTQFLDPTQYEPNAGGVLVPLSNNNRWGVHHVYIFQSGLVRAMPPQHEYNSFVAARNAAFTESFVTEQNIADNAIFRCYVIMKKTCTNLALDISNGDAEILHVGKFGNAIGGSTSALTLENIIAVLGYTPENEANKQNSLVTDGTGVKYPTVDAVNTGLTAKQDTLVSGNNIRTINGSSILGSGDLVISNGSTITRKAITSLNISTQDVAGFLTYVNAVSSFSIAANEHVIYEVTDTGQKFLIYKNNTTVGSGQTALVSTDVAEISPEQSLEISRWTFTDFHTSQNNSNFLIGASVNSGTVDANTYTSTSKDNYPSSVLVFSGVSANGGYRYTTYAASATGGGFKAQKGLTFFGIFTICANSSADTIIRIGLHTSVTQADSTDGAYLEIQGTTATFKTANNSVRSSSSTATLSYSTVPNQTYYLMMIHFDSLTSVTCKIKDDTGATVMNQTLSTNTPTSGRRFGCGFVGTITTAGSSRQILECDYIGVGSRKPNFLKNF